MKSTNQLNKTLDVKLLTITTNARLVTPIKRTYLAKETKDVMFQKRQLSATRMRKRIAANIPTLASKQDQNLKLKAKQEVL